MKWSKVKLSDVFDIARGGSPRPIDSFITDDPKGINWIMIGDTKSGSKYIASTAKKIKPEGVKKSREVKEGDFLLSNSMSFGRPYILKTSGCIHDGWLVLSPDLDKVNTDFFYHLFSSEILKRIFLANAAGAVVKNLNSEIVRNVEVLLPPLEEQKHIADILDRAESLKQKRQQALALADEYLRATFLDLFGDPITNPKGWPVRKLSDLCLMDRQTITPLERNGLPYLGLEHVESQTGRILVSSDETKEQEVKGNSFHFDENHILYGKLRPYLNKVALPSFEGISSTELVPLKTNTDIANKFFVAWILRSPTLVSTVMNANQGARMPRTNMSFMLSLSVGLPPKIEQDKFEQIVKKVEALKAKMQTSETEIEHLAKSLSQKAFRGELVK